MDVQPLDELPGPGGSPIQFATTCPRFPPEVKTDPGKLYPRIIDVQPLSGFSVASDCSDLKALDAMMTILYNHDPALLDMFLDDEHSDILFAHFSPQERYDIELRRKDSEWQLTIRERPCLNRRLQQRLPLLQATYKSHDITNQPAGPVAKQWEPVEARGTIFASRPPHNHFVYDTFEPHATTLARYMMLRRPWENSSGVEIRVIENLTKKKADEILALDDETSESEDS